MDSDQAPRSRKSPRPHPKISEPIHSPKIAPTTPSKDRSRRPRWTETNESGWRTPQRRSSHVAPHRPRNEITTRQKGRPSQGKEVSGHHRRGQLQPHMAGEGTAVRAILD
jgi:hypothetical protein